MAELLLVGSLWRVSELYGTDITNDIALSWGITLHMYLLLVLLGETLHIGHFILRGLVDPQLYVIARAQMLAFKIFELLFPFLQYMGDAIVATVKS